MRAYKRLDQRGFTLVELMIVVAIIGVLAALAIYGVTKYLAVAKTAEAKNTVGAITRSAVAAYDRESYAAGLIPVGTTGAAPAHTLCGSAAAAVPATPPGGTKYQPSAAPSTDFNTGDSLNGWMCLGFGLTQAIYYSYNYVNPGTTASGLGASAGAGSFEANAAGDLNNNGVYSYFGRGGYVSNSSIILTPQIAVTNEFE